MNDDVYYEGRQVCYSEYEEIHTATTRGIATACRYLHDMASIVVEQYLSV